jgi:excisionase family DNA binding protein
LNKLILYEVIVLEFLTVKEVAEKLKLSKRTVHNWIDEGVIRAIKVKDGSAVRIPASEVERILNEIFEIPPKPTSDRRKRNARSRL